MKKFYKRFSFIGVFLFVLIIIISIYGLYNAVSINAQNINAQNTDIQNTENIDTFSNLLDIHNIIVAGPDSYLSNTQLKGFINMFNSYNIKEKYNKILSTEENTVKLTASEILELHYYSLTLNDQEDFILNISNKKVDVSMDNNSILISYND